MGKGWKRELARDTIALGSIPFYIIVMARAVVGQYPVFVYQLLIALGVLIGLSYIVKFNSHIARCFVLWVFASLFYKHNFFTLFAFLLLVGVIISAKYLKEKNSMIIKGLILGIISSGIAYYLAGLI